MYPIYRLREAGYVADVAALTRRDVQLVIHDFDPESDAYTEKYGRKLPVDITFAEVDPAEYVALVIPGGRAPEYIRTDADVRRITEYFFEQQPPGRDDLPRPAGAGGLRAAARAHDRGLPAAEGRHGERRRDRRRRARLRRRQHGLVPRLAGHARVVAGVHERARAGRRPGLSARPMLAEGSGPPVLLLHGSGPGTTAAAWAPLIAALAPRHRVIAPDLLGFGAAAGPRARSGRRGRSRRSSWSTRSGSRRSPSSATRPAGRSRWPSRARARAR